MAADGENNAGPWGVTGPSGYSMRLAWRETFKVLREAGAAPAWAYGALVFYGALVTYISLVTQRSIPGQIVTTLIGLPVACLTSGYLAALFYGFTGRGEDALSRTRRRFWHLMLFVAAMASPALLLDIAFEPLLLASVGGALTVVAAAWIAALASMLFGAIINAFLTPLWGAVIAEQLPPGAALRRTLALSHGVRLKLFAASMMVRIVYLVATPALLWLASVSPVAAFPLYLMFSSLCMTATQVALSAFGGASYRQLRRLKPGQAFDDLDNIFS